MRNSGKLQLARWLSAALALGFVVGLAATAAQDTTNGTQSRRFFNDLFASGSDVRVTGPEIAHLFAAGESVTLDATVRETAHVAGRNVRVNRMVGENLYAAGYDVDVEAPVGEDVVAAGYRIEIGPNASVSRDVLAAGRTVVVRGPVSGNVSIRGRTVEIAGPISGSARITAREIRFADGARIDGTLSYSSREPVNVPANVIAPERVTASVTETETEDMRPWIAAAIVFSLLMLGLMALFAFVFRDRLAGTRAVIAARPWRDLALGIIATSALFGSILVLAVSLIGIPLIPLVIVLTPFVIFAGYLTTAHAIGAVLVKRARLLPGSGWAAFGAMLVGVLVLTLISAIPLLGWVIAVLAVIVGIGAWFALIISPATRGERVVAR
jgi:cytoskeletal protein CcmA (bactofilin family)